MGLDDFGTGYTSLEHLQRFHVDRMKIPAKFIRDLGRVRERSAIVRAKFGLARELGIAVVAEAVETRAALDYSDPFGDGYRDRTARMLCVRGEQRVHDAPVARRPRVDGEQRRTAHAALRF